MTKNRKGNKGFTLIEIMIVIGLIALLMAVLLPRMTRGQRAANDQIAASWLRQVVEAETQYRSKPPFTYTANKSDLQGATAKINPPLGNPPAGIDNNTDWDILSADAKDFCAVARHQNGTYWLQATASGIQATDVKIEDPMPTACQ